MRIENTALHSDEQVVSLTNTVNVIQCLCDSMLAYCSVKLMTKWIPNSFWSHDAIEQKITKLCLLFFLLFLLLSLSLSFFLQLFMGYTYNWQFLQSSCLCMTSRMKNNDHAWMRNNTNFLFIFMCNHSDGTLAQRNYRSHSPFLSPLLLVIALSPLLSFWQNAASPFIMYHSLPFLLPSSFSPFVFLSDPLKKHKNTDKNASVFQYVVTGWSETNDFYIHRIVNLQKKGFFYQNCTIKSKEQQHMVLTIITLIHKPCKWGRQQRGLVLIPHFMLACCCICL